MTDTTDAAAALSALAMQAKRFNDAVHLEIERICAELQEYGSTVLMAAEILRLRDEVKRLTKPMDCDNR